MTRVLFICGSLLGLSGCGGDIGLVMMGGSLATLIHTDKTVVDHAVGLSTGRDCSVLYLARDEPYCKPSVPIEPGQVAYMTGALYCYRTLCGKALSNFLNLMNQLLFRHNIIYKSNFFCLFGGQYLSC